MTYNQKFANIIKMMNIADESIVRINRFKYIIKYVESEYDNSKELVAIPASKTDLGRKSDIAKILSWDDYRYTHGGATFRKAVQFLHELNEYINLSDLEKAEGSTEYASIERYFDENGEETFIKSQAATTLIWKKKGRSLGYY